MWEEVSYMCVLSMVSQGYLLIGLFCKMTEQQGDCYHMFWVKDQNKIPTKLWWNDPIKKLMEVILLIWLVLPN